MKGRRGGSSVLLLAFTGASAIANNYYAQPLLPLIRDSLGLSTGVAGLMVTLGQLGYALGLLLLVPLGDIVQRRGLVLVMVGGSALGLAGIAMSSSGAMLLPAVFAVGLLSVLAQVLSVSTAAMVDVANRGRALATMVGGAALGMVLARSAAGFLADLGNWRDVYWVAAVLMAVQLPLLAWLLPSSSAGAGLSYPAVLRSMGGLLRAEPVLRRRILHGGASFAAYSAMWTTMALLLADAPFNYSAATIGLFGLTGAGAIVAASFGGRLVDRGHTHVSTGVAAFVTFLSWALLWFGRSTAIWLLAGMATVEGALRIFSIGNSVEIYRLRPDSMSRLNGVYMTCYFALGAAGSAGAVQVWDRYGWGGVCVLGASCSLVPVGMWLYEHRALARAAADPRPRLSPPVNSPAGQADLEANAEL